MEMEKEKEQEREREKQTEKEREKTKVKGKEKKTTRKRKKKGKKEKGGLIRKALFSLLHVACILFSCCSLLIIHHISKIIKQCDRSCKKNGSCWLPITSDYAWNLIAFGLLLEAILDQIWTQLKAEVVFNRLLIKQIFFEGFGVGFAPLELLEFWESVRPCGLYTDGEIVSFGAWEPARQCCVSA